MKNYIYVFLSNSSGLLISIFTFTILPQTLTVTEYGYWQMYYLYASFLGLFTFGITDGFHLKYSGSTRKSLNKKSVKSTLLLVVALNTFGGMFIFFLSFLFGSSSYETTIIRFLSFTLVFFNSYGFFLHLSQVTSQFKEYSLLLMLDKLLFLIGIFILYISEQLHVSNVIALFLGIKIILSLKSFITNISYFSKNIKLELINIFESFQLIKSGIILMLLLLISNLLINYPRVIFSYKEDIKSFALLSFAFSLILVIVQVLSSASVIFFQSISKVSDSLTHKYLDMTSRLISSLFPVLVFFYMIIKFLIPIFFLKYIEIMEYLYLIFPIILIQIRYNLLILNCYKKEGALKEILFNSLIHLILGFSLIFLVSQNIKVSLFIYIILHLSNSIFLNERLRNKFKYQIHYSWKEFVYILLFIIFNSSYFNHLVIVLNILLITTYIFINYSLYKSLIIYNYKKVSE
ncbi:hypothetical protein [Exiguobacterium sp. USCH10]|uniref:hypothetical protein n=1 Tax=Exiguobacterium sp. USCH10 TaxID=3024839 RepID=UPI0030A2A5A8